MKKIVSVLVVILSLLMCTLVGCSSNSSQQTHTRITLNADNYDEYISLNFYYSDCQIIAIEESEPISTCSIFAIVTIETSKKIDCIFEDVVLSYAPADLSWETYGWGKITAALDINGYSKSSFSFYYAASLVNLPYFGEHLLKDISVSGHLIVPIEDMK